jgi:hypothetical protein
MAAEFLLSQSTQRNFSQGEFTPSVRENLLNFINTNIVMKSHTNIVVIKQNYMPLENIMAKLYLYVVIAISYIYKLYLYRYMLMFLLENRRDLMHTL